METFPLRERKRQRAFSGEYHCCHSDRLDQDNVDVDDNVDDDNWSDYETYDEDENENDEDDRSERDFGRFLLYTLGNPPLLTPSKFDKILTGLL